MKSIQLNIDGREVIGQIGQTLLDVCQQNNIDVPTLCHDKRVEIYGACGICVVEMEGSPKLLRACATTISDGMIIKTNTDKVRKSRQTALELLLSDHIGDCRPPCVLACPGETDCQGYVGLIANGEYQEAVKVIKDRLPLPAAIGRVCPHPCEEACRRTLVEEPISIAQLKSFAADIDLHADDVFTPEIEKETGKTIAIIGGGPGGLSAAYFLRKSGHAVTIYDAMPKMGGMLRYGIPEYRLPKSVVDEEATLIEQMGVRFVNNVNIGQDVTFAHIKKNHDATLVAIGAWKSTALGCVGEQFQGVIGGIDFLRDVSLNNHLLHGKKIAVVGGGNTAMDACRTAVRLCASEVYNIYRRTKAEMPAEEIEIIEAEEEGVIFKNLTNPVEIIEENGTVAQIKLQQMQLGEPDASGRRSPVPMEGCFETLDVDIVVIAIGQALNPTGFEQLELTRRGNIAADEKTFRTNVDGVFAIGDATNKGAGIAIEAIGDARKAATVIHSYLNGETIGYQTPFMVTREVTADMLADRPRIARAKMPHLTPSQRKHTFAEVNQGYTEEQAKNEAKRCLECGCHDYFECKLLEYANHYGITDRKKYEGTEMHHRAPDVSNPFMFRNPDKCILCGLCVRICDEVMGRTALGLVDRGFDTVVAPELAKPLKETNCISCGQCASACPTGAIGERLPIVKSVPLKENMTNTVCSFCSVGCKTKVSSKGHMLLRSLPDKENDGLLCVKGRFGFAEGQKQRITSPMIRKDNRLVAVSFAEAYTYITKRVQGISMRTGSNSIGVSISDKLTNEEIFLLKQYAETRIGTENVFSFNSKRSGLKEVIGKDCSTNTLDELAATDVIVLICSDIIHNHTIAGLKIKKAVENGAKLIVINHLETQADEWASIKIGVTNDIEPLRQFAKAVLGCGKKPAHVTDANFAAFAESFESVHVAEDVQQAAALYCGAKKAMIVFEQNEVTTDGARLIASIAVASGHIGSPRDGIIQLKPNCNSQGLVDMGIKKDPRQVKQAITGGSMRALLVFGEDIPAYNISGLEFLMVQDMFLTETAEKADVVLPLGSFAEGAGTFTASDRRIQTLNQVIPSLIGKANWQMFAELAALSYASLTDIQAHIGRTVPGYRGLGDTSDDTRRNPIGDNPVLCTDGFYFADKKANLIPSKQSQLIAHLPNTNATMNRFVNFLDQEQLTRH